MVKGLDNIRWKLFKIKKNFYLRNGLKKGLIHKYEDELIEKLRGIYYGPIPASILLLCTGLCDGKCYDRALLLTHGMQDDDFKMVDADIDTIRLNPKFTSSGKYDLHYGNHCFIEKTKNDGSVWVYDTSAGLVYKKSLYYKIENPKITKINNKDTVMNWCEWQEIKCANIDKDKDSLPFFLPIITEIADRQTFYRDEVFHEIEIFKNYINYDELCKEMEKDMAKRL